MASHKRTRTNLWEIYLVYCLRKANIFLLLYQCLLYWLGFFLLINYGLQKESVQHSMILVR